MLTLVDDQKIGLLPEIYIPDARQQETCDGVLVPHNSKVRSPLLVLRPLP